LLRFSAEAAVRRFSYMLWPTGLAFGLVAEWVGGPELVVFDALAGFALLLLGLLAWSRRSDCTVGLLMAGAGFAWFLGTMWSPAVFLHRGPLAQVLLSYPTGRLSSRLDRAAVGAAYVYAAAYPVADNDYATLAFAVGLVAFALGRYVVASGPERMARLAPLIAGTAFGLVIAFGAGTRLGGVGHGRAELLAYDLTVLLIAVALSADLLRGRWTQAAVTGLVIDLGEAAASGRLRDRLARALGDPTLAVAYRVPGEDEYVDETGRQVQLSPADEDRAVTPIDEDGERVAVLMHDRAVLDDPRLLSAVASATRLAVSNARLQAEVRTRVAEVEASRRRIVAASDRQRRLFEQELREGAERRLARVASLLEHSGGPLEDVGDALAAARAELREFARGVHPATLTERGLEVAVEELAERSPFPVEVLASGTRSPPAVEAAAYFVCSESLANVAKYARASHVQIAIAREGERLTVAVSDDGIGGADPSTGSGLRGLGDRVATLGGRLTVASPPGGGTRVAAELPCD
jgi:signal transduction histidine kinase